MTTAETGERPVCWRSECRNGCYYPGVCSLTPTQTNATCVHGWREGDCPTCAACSACDGRCGTCPYLRPSEHPKDD